MRKGDLGSKERKLVTDEDTEELISRSVSKRFSPHE
jgi:hypothetical protein